MLLIRLLVILLTLNANTWPSPVHSDALSYKRAIAQRADRELSRLAGEPCTVSGVSRSWRQPRSIFSSQHRPPAVYARTDTSLRALRAARSAPAVNAGGCEGDAEVEEKESWRDDEDVDNGFVTSPERQHVDNRDSRDQDFVKDAATKGPVRKAGGQSEVPRGSGFRRARSLFDTEPYEKAQLQLDTAVEDDYSGEMEEADPTVSLPTSSSSPWGGSVPTVPPTWMTALYFSGRREQLKLKTSVRVDLPRDKFSLELWVKPEGGQSNPAVIAGG